MSLGGGFAFAHRNMRTASAEANALFASGAFL